MTPRRRYYTMIYDSTACKWKVRAIQRRSFLFSLLFLFSSVAESVARARDCVHKRDERDGPVWLFKFSSNTLLSRKLFAPASPINTFSLAFRSRPPLVAYVRERAYVCARMYAIIEV